MSFKFFFNFLNNHGFLFVVEWLYFITATANLSILEKNNNNSFYIFAEFAIEEGKNEKNISDNISGVEHTS